MSDELLDMQRDTWNRLLIVTGIIGLLGFWWLMLATVPFGLEYAIWLGTAALNVILYFVARARFREATWAWTCALVTLLVFSIPWKSIPNLGPLPYGLMLIVIMSSVLISRSAPLVITGLATVLYPVAAAVTSRLTTEVWGNILPPLVMAWATAILSWISSDQLITALEWTSKARLDANSQAESLRQNRDALEKSLKIRDGLNAQLQETHEQVMRRAAQFEAMAEVSRRITSLLDLEQLLVEVTNLICDQFGYYCASVFLIDEQDRMLALRAAGGELGPALLQRKVRLPMDDTSLNGHAVGTGQIQQVGNVSMSPFVLRHALLPQTASELVIPLRIGQQIVGTLDVQSIQFNSFSKDDVAVLQGLADQVAVAIQNTRLFQQAQLALQELEMTNRLLTRQGWQEYLQQQSATRQVELGIAGAPVTAAEAPPEPLSIPLELRGQPLGQMTLRREGDRAWSEDEIEMIKAVALQTVMAAENARLFEQTQQRAQREQLITQIATKVRAAPDIDSILRTGVQEIRRVLGASHGIVRLGIESRLRPPDGNGQAGVGGN